MLSDFTTVSIWISFKSPGTATLYVFVAEDVPFVMVAVSVALLSFKCLFTTALDPWTATALSAAVTFQETVEP